MKVLVPADSPIKDLADVKGHKVTFTRPDSNSGCKALLVLLRDEHDMQPDRDYTWGFSLGHEDSIKGVAAKEFEVGARGQRHSGAHGGTRAKSIRNAFRSIHESERFPPATIGIVYNLTPELRDAIRETLLAFRTARHRSGRRIRRRCRRSSCRSTTSTIGPTRGASISWSPKSRKGEIAANCCRCRSAS